ncbi:MAG: hypothetical protein OXU20_40290 [Myxococcales bacterium]|nr:hypothetical protein [Myxococcales bacterium]MDD9968428.1 hypothetical protein [Myxococcales bacterium]
MTAGTGRGLLWCAVGFLALGAASIHAERVGVFVDDAIYLTSGIELAHGGGYRVPFLPGDPLAGKYPPLYPALLGVASWVLPPLPQSLLYYKLWTLLMAVPGLVFTVRWLALEGPEGDRRWTPFVVGGTAFNAGLLSICGEAMSEALFFSLLMATLWRMRSAEYLGPSREGRVAFMGALGCAVLLTHTRSLGALALPVVLLRGPRLLGMRRTLAAGAASLVTLLPWWWWSRLHVPQHEPMAEALPYLTGYGYHTDAVLEYFRSSTSSLSHYASACMRATVKGLGTTVLPWPNRYTVEVLRAPIGPSAVVATGLVLVGLAVRLKQRRAAAELLLIYLVVASAWPWFNKTRFFVAVLPLILWCMLGALQLVSAKRDSASRLLVAGLFGLMLVSNGTDYLTQGFMQGSTAEAIAGPDPDGHGSAITRACKWIQDNTPSNAILVADFTGPLLAIHCHRDALPYRMALTSPGEHLASLLEARPAGTAPLESVLARARPVLANRPLYHVWLCEHACDVPTLARSWEAVFRDRSLPDAAIAIRRIKRAAWRESPRD